MTEARNFWEERYASDDRVWSGRVNALLAEVARPLTPKRALDLGCGEGADVIWLAQQGWQATGIDISETAIARARAAASEAGVDATFIAGDLSQLDHTGPYDLVAASFLHSPVELPRIEILRHAATLVADCGHLLVISHAAAPPWASARMHERRFSTPEEEADELGLDPVQWDTLLCETRPRETKDPDGKPAVLDDGILLLRRDCGGAIAPR